jgi:hypothetical protein
MEMGARELRDRSVLPCVLAAQEQTKKSKTVPVQNLNIRSIGSPKKPKFFLTPTLMLSRAAQICPILLGTASPFKMSNDRWNIYLTSGA